MKAINEAMNEVVSEVVSEAMGWWVSIVTTSREPMDLIQ
jgi:hypothetical protein